MKIVNVKIEQAGGKYGHFKCPICQEDASFKFTAASGWCDGCDNQFYYTGGLNLTEVEEGQFGTHGMELEVQ